ncbi:DUF2520 domain-containing protein [Cryomorphaceae bacterium]|nr:DUF2520 domain-containing protein [Cryomorphaceae bacterium]
MDRIVLIGAGRLAFHLGQALQAVGFDLIGLYNRTADNGKELAEALGAELYLSYDEIPRDADWYLIAVSDSAIPEVSEKLEGVKGLVTHTSGSVDLDVLQVHERRGVFYPLQTFSRQKEVVFHQIPMLIEANSSDSEELLLGAAARISHRVERVDSYQRQYLHLAAVFACNFSNHMYSIAEKLMKQRGMKFDLLHPLIAETTQKALEQGPRSSQTGPAIRKDQEILNKHLTLLDDPLWKDLYTLISQSIVDK